MPDAMKAAWQDMEQEAADELVRRECHDALPLGTITTVVLVAEGYAVSSNAIRRRFEMATRWV